MQVSEFAFRLFLLFFPGLICAYIVDALTNHPPRKPFFFVAKGLLLGALAYATYWLALRILVPVCNFNFGSKFSGHAYFTDAIHSSTAPISLVEITVVCFLAVLLAFVLAAAINKKVLFHVARLLGVSKKFGDLDVWSFILNEPNIEYVTVRDYQRDLAYDGWIRVFSDNAKNAELVLGDAAVYRNSTGEFLYQVGAVYLSLERTSIVLEFRDIEVTQPIQH